MIRDIRRKLVSVSRYRVNRTARRVVGVVYEGVGTKQWLEGYRQQIRIRRDELNECQEFRLGHVRFCKSADFKFRSKSFRVQGNPDYSVRIHTQNSTKVVLGRIWLLGKPSCKSLQIFFAGTS